MQLSSNRTPLLPGVVPFVHVLHPITCMQATRDNGGNLTGALKFSVRFLCAFSFTPNPTRPGSIRVQWGVDGGWFQCQASSGRWWWCLRSCVHSGPSQSEMIKCNRTVITFHLTRNASHSTRWCGLEKGFATHGAPRSRTVFCVQNKKRRDLSSPEGVQMQNQLLCSLSFFLFGSPSVTEGKGIVVRCSRDGTVGVENRSPYLLLPTGVCRTFTAELGLSPGIGFVRISAFEIKTRNVNGGLVKGEAWVPRERFGSVAVVWGTFKT